MSNTYTKVLTKGLKTDLSKTSIGNGILRFTTDTKELFLDKDNSSRIQISNVDLSLTEAQITSSSNLLNKLYLASDTLNLFSSNGSTVKKIGEAGNYNPSEISGTDNQPYYPVMYGDDGVNKSGYSEDFCYNPNTGELIFGGVSIRKTLDSINNTYIVDISVV